MKKWNDIFKSYEDKMMEVTDLLSIEELAVIIKLLPKENRWILMFRYCNGYTEKEIAAYCKVKKREIKKWLAESVDSFVEECKRYFPDRFENK